MAEPLRLAQFLRERCARNQYGLHYLNLEQTLLLIPWPVVPRPNEESPPGFQMFREWAELSHRRRGNNEAPELRESATQQKHRFRNALARANGIVYRKDITVEGARVYEFVDCRRPHAGSDAQSPYSQTTTDEYLDDDFCDPSSVFSVSPQKEPFTALTQPGPSNQLYLNGSTYSVPYNTGPYNPLEQVHSSSTQVVSSVANIQPMDQYSHAMTNGHNNIDDLFLDEFLQNNSPQPPDPIQQTQQQPQVNLSVSPSVHQYSINPDPLPQAPVPQVPSELEIHVHFRQDEASCIPVTNTFGCRVYFGKNIPDLSQLLEKEHLENLMKRFRFQKEIYYGPESLQQVQLPRPNSYMRSTAQREKTNAILANMDRGLLLLLQSDNAPNQMNIPDVYAMRLCQTRIFPCPNGTTTESETLKRMEWTKVFDGKYFCDQIYAADQSPNGSENFPSPSFTFSLGQKPVSEERALLLVCVTVTVLKAQQLIQSKLDCAGNDICISYINSTDVEARTLANRLTETLTL